MISHFFTAPFSLSLLHIHHYIAFPGDDEIHGEFLFVFAPFQKAGDGTGHAAGRTACSPGGGPAAGTAVPVGRHQVHHHFIVGVHVIEFREEIPELALGGLVHGAVVLSRPVPSILSLDSIAPVAAVPLGQGLADPGSGIAAADDQVHGARRLFIRDPEIDGPGDFLRPVGLEGQGDGQEASLYGGGGSGSPHHFRHFTAGSGFHVHIDVLDGHFVEPVVHQHVRSHVQFRIRQLPDIGSAVEHVFPAEPDGPFLLSLGRDGEPDPGSTGPFPVFGHAHRIVGDPVHQGGHQVLIGDQLDIAAFVQPPVLVGDGDVHGNDGSVFPFFSGNAAEPVLADPSQGLAQSPHFESTLDIGHGGKNPGIGHEIVGIPVLEEGVAEGQDPSFFIGPGHGTDGPDDHIPPDQGNPHGTARFQFHIVQGFRAPGHRIRSEPEGRQSFIEMGHPVGGKPADHQRCALGQEYGRPGIGFVKEPEHFADGSQEAVIGVGKGLAVGHGSRQPAVDVHRTAAHALGDAAAFLQQRPGCFDQDVVAPGFRTGDPQDLHIEGFDVRAPDHRLSVAFHPRLQFFHRNGGDGGAHQGHHRHQASQGQHQEPLPLHTIHISSCKKEGVIVSSHPLVPVILQKPASGPSGLDGGHHLIRSNLAAGGHFHGNHFSAAVGTGCRCRPGQGLHRYQYRAFRYLGAHRNHRCHLAGQTAFLGLHPCRLGHTQGQQYHQQGCCPYFSVFQDFV